MINCKRNTDLILSRLFILLFAIFTIPHIAAQTYTNDLEDSSFDEIWIGTATIDSGFSHSGSHYSLTDSLHPYGLGVEMIFPIERRGNNTIVEIEGWVKSEVKNANALYVITIENEGLNVLWKGIPLSQILIEENQWYKFYDTICIPANIASTGKLKTYLWNAGKYKKVGIDDLRITFKKRKNPSYLPEISNHEYSQKSSDHKLLFHNGYYRVIHNNITKQIIILNHKGEYLTYNISLFEEVQIKDERISYYDDFDFQGEKKHDDLTILRFELKTRFKKVKLLLDCKVNSPQIQLHIEEKYVKNVDIARSSIIIDAAQNPSEIYRQNRKLHAMDFQKEYWLDKQGIKFGEGDSSFFIYHTPDVSSLQFDNENNRLLVNLDWENDHPFFRFPLNPDSNNWKKEESASSYKRRNKREYSFNITIGNHANSIPRFMKNPSGYEAIYIWTEHADYSDIRTNRATYFGSENIRNADSATGGFVKYNIPITKSVFYDNPDSISNFKVSRGLFNTLECTILTDKEFSEFLVQISKKGSDICLHTPEQFTTTPKRLEEALLYMQMNFGSPSWIDHGNNNGPQNNREDLICDATLKKSPFYAIDLWNKYGVKYLHNAYYEELNTYKDWQFEASLEKPYSGYGDFFPKPDYYKHPTKTEDLYHWTTTSALFIYEPYLWDYLFNPSKLTSLVDNWSVEINHVYPAWVDPKKGMWTYDNDSTIIAQPGFNQALANLANLRDAGKLNICTIDSFLDYRTSIDNIDYHILPDGRVKLTNKNDFEIIGLSLVAFAKAVSVDGLIPEHKFSGEEIIFWFDLGVGESKVIRIIDN